MTSAVPKMKQKPAEGQRPEMYFEEGGMPETVSHELCHSCAAKQEQCPHFQCCIIPLTSTHNAHIVPYVPGHGSCHVLLQGCQHCIDVIP